MSVVQGFRDSNSRGNTLDRIFGNLNGEAALLGIPVNVAPNGALFKLSLTASNTTVRGYSQTQAFTLLVEP
jgi:hypothetical protein